MWQIKTEEIELFGEKLLLSERTARDSNKLTLFSADKIGKSYPDLLLESAIAIEDALKINWINLPWYKFLKKRSYKKKFNKLNIIASFPASMIFDTAKRIAILEGYNEDDEKKKMIQEE